MKPKSAQCLIVFIPLLHLDKWSENYLQFLNVSDKEKNPKRARNKIFKFGERGR